MRHFPIAVRAYAYLALLAVLLWMPGIQAQTLSDTYKLNTGDKIRVTVFGHPDLSGEFEIDAEGMVILPLIRSIEVKGRSARDVEEAIADALSPDYLKNPRVSAEILTFRPVYVLGEVERPGSYPYTNGLTVIESVALAGGFTYRARKKRITVTRGSDPDKEKIKVDANTVILPGDVIEVPERRF